MTNPTYYSPMRTFSLGLKLTFYLKKGETRYEKV